MPKVSGMICAICLCILIYINTLGVNIPCSALIMLVGHLACKKLDVGLLVVTI